MVADTDFRASAGEVEVAIDVSLARPSFDRFPAH
jgi:hypothetical protein